MEENQQVDRRVSRSKQALKKALLSLMQGKEFKKITITDIVQTADLNRGTFYKHFQYKEDILDEIIDDVISSLISSYREPYKNSLAIDIETLPSTAVKIFDHVTQYEDFYTLIVKSNTLIEFQSKLCTVLKELALKDLIAHQSHPTIDRELQASYHAYAIFGMIIEWVQHGFIHSSTYMAEQLLAILKNRPLHGVYTTAKFTNTKDS